MITLVGAVPVLWLWLRARSVPALEEELRLEDRTLQPRSAGCIC